MWLPWGSSPNSSSTSQSKPESPSKASTSTSHWVHSLPSEPSDYPAYLVERLRSLPPEALVVGFAAGSASVLGTRALYRRYLWRIPNAGWVTPDMLKTKKRWVKGYVTKVGDADGFRLYHTPSIGWRWPLKFRHIPSPKNGNDAMKDKTLAIRIAGADAPEGPSYGRPAQEFYFEAKGWFKERVEGRFVYCQLLSKDHYGRLVASVHAPRSFLPGVFFKGPSVSIDMVRAGWAVVYEQSGAQYGEYGKDYYKQLEEEAIAARRGIWINGELAESPAEYKKRIREGKHAKPTEIDEEESELSAQNETYDRGFIRRLFSR